jgi:hypothetical protein
MQCNQSFTAIPLCDVHHDLSLCFGLSCISIPKAFPDTNCWPSIKASMGHIFVWPASWGPIWFACLTLFMRIVAAIGTFTVSGVSNWCETKVSKIRIIDKVGTTASARFHSECFTSSCRAAVVSPFLGVWVNYAIAIAYDILASVLCLWFLLRLKGNNPL